jgi:aspartate ammonia-lyase
VDTVQAATIRIEHDLLGAKEVPMDCYYGIHTLRAIENFKISSQKVGQNSHFIRALAQVKKASAQANLSFNKLTETQSLAIQRACDDLINETQKWQDSFPIDIYQGGAGTSINMNTNEVIANIALESLGHQKVNMTSFTRMIISTNHNQRMMCILQRFVYRLIVL